MRVSIVSRSARLLNRDAGVRKVFPKHSGPKLLPRAEITTPLLLSPRAVNKDGQTWKSPNVAHTDSWQVVPQIRKPRANRRSRPSNRI